MNDLMPREKLERFGAAHLTDVELLRVLIGSGNKQAFAMFRGTQDEATGD